MRMDKNTKYISDVYPLKAQFIRNEPIEIAVELFNPANEPFSGELEVKTGYLHETVEKVNIRLDILSGGQKVCVRLEPKDVDFMGYGVDVDLYSGGELLDTFSSSFDVVAGWRKSTRYGFLSDFYPGEEEEAEDVKGLCKFHINLVQFYDWMYRHDELVPPVSEFTDLMGRNLSRKAVQEKISLCHRYGMKAIAYGAVYAASRNFYEKHADWALYSSSGKVLDFIQTFFIMDISEDCPWHRHIIGQYKNAVEQLNFDGIHMDTYGYPKTAISRREGVEKIVRLEEHFPVLINNTRKEFENTRRDACLIFNNVGNWPVEAVACAEQDAIYIEVWKPYERYHHIQQLILRAKHLGAGKPVILAAYLKPFLEDTGAAKYRAEMSSLILTAAIAANGGYHMLLGERGGILTQGYYADYSKLDEVFLRVMRNYYDFIIRYANLFFAGDIKDVSMTHVDGDNLEYVFENLEYSTYGQPGKVWVIVRESPRYKTVSFINLIGNDDLWNKGKERPLPVKEIIVKAQADGRVKSVFLASPDENMGRPARIAFRMEEGAHGETVVADIPQVNIWSLLVMELECFEY